MFNLPAATGTPPAVNHTEKLSPQMGDYTSTNPAAQQVLDDNPELANILHALDGAVDALAGSWEGATNASQRTSKEVLDAKARKSVFEARQTDSMNKEMASRRSAQLEVHDRDIDAAIAKHETQVGLATAVTGLFAGSRDTVNTAKALINKRANDGRPIQLARPVALPKGQSPRDVIISQRALLAGLDAEKSVIKSAPIPFDVAVAQARAKIAALAAAGRPRVSVGERRADVRLPSIPLNVEPMIGSAAVDITDAAALIAFLLQDKLTDAVEATMRAHYAGVELALAPEERAKRMADLAERRLSVERVEVAAVRAVWATGDFTVGLRAGTDPRAVLNIE